METLTKEIQASIMPKDAMTRLKEGNHRFLQNSKTERDLLTQVEKTGSGQFPFAALLSCIDSRVPAELVFDQGIGDIFNVRVAGNIVNEDILGSLEYSCKVAGSKLVLVLGHTRCGAVTSACKHVELGNITPLLDKIQPAVGSVVKGDLTPELIEEVAVKNVENSIEQIRKESPILKEMEDNGEIVIAGAIYDVASGAVEFL
ncbi:MAG: carbonic anhydrase family protein [Lutimonas sp.]